MSSGGFQKGHKRKNSHLFMDQATSGASVNSYDIELANIDGASNSSVVNSTISPYLNSRTVSIDNISQISYDLETQPTRDSRVLKMWELEYWNKKFSHDKKPFFFTLLFGIFLVIVFLFYPHTARHNPMSNSDSSSRNNSLNKDRFTIENILNGDFDIEQSTFNFITPPETFIRYDRDPGLYFTTERDTDDGTIRFVAKQLYSPTFKKDLGINKFSYDGIEYEVNSIKVSYKLDKVLLGTNIRQRFRHSTYGQYWIRDVESGQTIPLVPWDDYSEPVELSYAYFSPHYNFVYFNYKNNIYLRSLYDNSRGTMQITFDTDENILNGITDWIYEEEVLADDKALWWSPDDSSFVFAQFNDTNVPTYKFPLYTTNKQYSSFAQIKYPKPGCSNPSLSLLMFDMKTGVISRIPTLSTTNDFILYDLQWIDNHNFIFKTTDRYSKNLKVLRHDVVKDETTLIRSMDASKYNGWIDKTKKIVPVLPDKQKNRVEYGYLDIHEDSNGFNHIFYYPTINTSVGIQLTFGNWEITSSGIVGIGYEDNIVFFTANKIATMGQHLYAVYLNKNNINDEDLITLQDPNNVDTYYDFEFSSSTRYTLMKKLGPQFPKAWAGSTNEILSIGEEKLVSSDSVINIINVEDVENLLTKYNYPVTSYKSMELDDGIEINFIEIKPANINPKKKYPLLVNVYGGPGSMTFTKKASLSLEEAVVSGLDAIVLKIEPRGTGGKGWNFRSWATGKLGYWEPRDVTEVTKKFIKHNKGLIDEESVAIWGWSYGGFSTLKTVEFDEGKTFKYAVAVAPVTNWKYYDSIYTERYMGSLQENQEGYEQIALISNAKVFKNLSKFMLVHGTADDNVHIQNTYSLVDELILYGVRNFEMEIFPDSDHTITFHNAQRVIFERLYYWFDDAFSGKFQNNV